MRIRAVLFSLAAVLALPSSAMAQTWYIGGSAGGSIQSDSSNAGTTGAFTSGNGSPAVPNGTQVAAGTPYGWTTDFDTGYQITAEAGLTYPNGLRSGVELVYSKSDVDGHSGVSLGGTNIDGVDAAVLTGSPTQLGASVGAVVATDDGEVSNLGAFANLYYDFNREGTIQPYVGAGLGFTQVDVTYKPSGVNIIDADDTVFSWQLKAGATWRVNDSWDVYGEYAYRQSEDLDFSNRLFPGSLSVENQSNNIAVGVRYRFK